MESKKIKGGVVITLDDTEVNKLFIERSESVPPLTKKLLKEIFYRKGE